MVDYIFGPQPAVDITTAQLVSQEGMSGSVYASEADAQSQTSPLSVTVAGGVPATTIAVSAFGQLPEFIVVDLYQVWWRSGDIIVHLMSFDGLLESVEATADAAELSKAAAESANSSAQALDAIRMKLAGSAVAQGANFWGVYPSGALPIPPNDGQYHWLLEIV